MYCFRKKIATYKIASAIYLAFFITLVVYFSLIILWGRKIHLTRVASAEQDTPNLSCDNLRASKFHFSLINKCAGQRKSVGSICLILTGLLYTSLQKWGTVRYMKGKVYSNPTQASWHLCCELNHYGITVVVVIYS